MEETLMKDKLFGVLQRVGRFFMLPIAILPIAGFNFKTPGREDDDQETNLYTRADVNAAKENKAKGTVPGNDEVSALIVSGLGGSNNIIDVDCCATRLRITVNNSNIMKDEDLKQSGAAGVIKKGNGIQVIYGPRVTVIKSNLEDYLTREGNTREDNIREDNTREDNTREDNTHEGIAR
jgi:glucose PTS system EIICBA or EIICB component